jgi:hypothetical protein
MLDERPEESAIDRADRHLRIDGQVCVRHG